MGSARRTLTLAAVPSSVSETRRVASSLLRDVGAVAPFVDAVVLVVSELVTNAVRHAGGPELELRLEVTAVSASVGVRDASPTPPRLVAAYEGGGRGMVVVGALAHRWHVEALPDGKVVWAHLRA